MVPPAWLVAQRWERLLFAHWPVQPAELASQLPPHVEPDIRDGDAWLAIVAFVMVGTRASGPPWRPVLEPIPELNVRTYVRRARAPRPRVPRRADRALLPLRVGSDLRAVGGR